MQESEFCSMVQPNLIKLHTVTDLCVIIIKKFVHQDLQIIMIFFVENPFKISAKGWNSCSHFFFFDFQLKSKAKQKNKSEQNICLQQKHCSYRVPCPATSFLFFIQPEKQYSHFPFIHGTKWCHKTVRSYLHLKKVATFFVSFL